MSHTSANYEKVHTSTSDIRFPSWLQGFNRRWYAPNCQAVYLCFNGQGVAEALEDAVSHYGGGVKIRGGAHCYENFVYSEETRAILDLSPMDALGVDDERGYYLEAGGTNWGAFKALFNRFGYVVPGGSCYSVGLGGHISGGGYGLLSRLHGLTVDWLSGVEMVIKDDPKSPARLIYVSEDSKGDEYDLYWAQRGGGGGNYGVITRYYYKSLPKAPAKALISTTAFPWAKLTVDALDELLAAYAELSARDDNGALFGLFKLNHQSNQEIQLLMQAAYDDGDAAHARRLIEEFHDTLAKIVRHGPPTRPIHGHGGWAVQQSHATETIQEYTFYEAVQNLNGSGPNQRGKYKSAYMRKAFPRDQVEALFDGLQQVPPGLSDSDMEQSLVQVDTYGGAINSVAGDATPVPQRSSIMKLQYQTYWSDAANDQPHLTWIRSLYKSVYDQYGGTPDPARDPDGVVDGCYYNYPDCDLTDALGLDGALRLYFLENFESNPRNLIKVKKRWDPVNYFNNSQSIPVR